MGLKSFVLAVVSAVVFLVPADASVMLNFVFDPATTAGGGTSTQFGAGSWHLFALDLNDDSAGISSYSIDVLGATSVYHRSPNVMVEGPDGDMFPAGFSLARTGTNNSTMQAAQTVPELTPFRLGGFGQTAGDFQSAIAAIDPTAVVATSGTSTSWGSYLTAPASIDGRQWMFVGEGTYADGILPTIGADKTRLQVYNPNMSIRYSDVCVGMACTPLNPPPPPPPPPPPIVPPPGLPPTSPPPTSPSPPPVNLPVNPHASVVFDLVIDPATVAGGGSSTHSGAGTWQLFALDTNQDSLGISSYSVDVRGATSVLHRSPVANVETPDGDVVSAGFSLVRTGSSNPIQAAQGVEEMTPFRIAGFGKTTGDFSSEIAAVDPAASILGNPISSTWGGGTSSPESIDDIQWMLVAEGTYGPDGLPWISPEYTSVTVYNQDFSQRFSDVCIGWPCSPVPAPNRLPPPVDPEPDPVVTPPVVDPVFPVPDEEAPPVPDVPPHILPIEVIEVPQVEDPPIEVPPVYDPPIAEVPVVDPVPPIEEPTWFPEYEIISLPFILPEGSLTNGRYVLRWGEEFLEAAPWIVGTIDIGTVIDQTDFQLFTTNDGGYTTYQAVLLGTTNGAGGFTRLAYDSNGDIFSVDSSLNAGVPEPTGAALAVVAMLTSSLAFRRPFPPQNPPQSLDRTMV